MFARRPGGVLGRVLVPKARPILSSAPAFLAAPCGAGAAAYPFRCGLRSCEASGAGHSGHSAPVTYRPATWIAFLTPDAREPNDTLLYFRHGRPECMEYVVLQTTMMT